MKNTPEVIEAIRAEFEPIMLARLIESGETATGLHFAFERTNNGTGRYTMCRVRDAFEGYLLARLAKVNPEPPEISIIWYPSWEEVNRAMWVPALEAEGLTEADIDDGGFIGHTEDGQQVSVSAEEALQAVDAMGCWGFCDSATNTIHAWAKADASQETVIHMLAHEIGHLTGLASPDPLTEEMRAEQFGRTAKLALSLMQSRFSFA